MKRLIFILLTLALASCKPEPYLGPLDSPVGNWEGVKGEYYFNGEMVAELDSCVFSAISFYKQGYCCIEGVKGAFPFIYDNVSGDLQIDSTLWSVSVLTGAEMVMKFVDRIYPEPKPAAEEAADTDDAETETGGTDPEEGEEPEDGDTETGDGTEDPGEGDEPSEPSEPEEPEVKPDANGVYLPAEFRGFTIEADSNGYYYINASGNLTYCNFKGVKDPDGNLHIDFWYDSHNNHFIPLVVEVEEK